MSNSKYGKSTEGNPPEMCVQWQNKLWVRYGQEQLSFCHPELSIPGGTGRCRLGLACLGSTAEGFRLARLVHPYCLRPVVSVRWKILT